MVFPPQGEPLSLMDPHLTKVLQTYLEAVEGVKFSGVTFNEIPHHAGRLTDLDDRRPVEVAAADFTHNRLPFGRDRHVLDMDRGNAARDPLDPGRGIATSVGNPIGVKLEPDRAVEFINQQLQRNVLWIHAGRVIREWRQFMTVIVVADPQSPASERLSDPAEFVGQDLPPLRIVSGAEPTDSRQFTIEYPVIIEGALRIAQLLDALVRRPADKTIVVEDLFKFANLNGPDS